MRSVGDTPNCPLIEGLAEINHHRGDEGREVRNLVGALVGGGHGLSEEDDSRINEDGEDVNSKCIVQVQPVLQRQQLPLQGAVVRWDRFLPVRSLRVLLVENDDSTRFVVSALLRNCSYEVTAVANGLEAWEILENPTNHIDLVLTEVVMPGLSGIGLLTKLTSHKTFKNIPLIMMSSSDSMGIVFKCLSKGASDFLVKPIRKNELKNLWQHVWRKCQSSSFSGSESGIRIQKSSNSKSVEGSGNGDSGSNDKDDDWSNDLDVKDGSDHGSGTQSSWSKRVIEVDETQQLSQWDQYGEPPDSTCAQVIHSHSEALTNYWVPKAATTERNKEGNELDNASMGKFLEIGVPKNQELLHEEPHQNGWKGVADNTKSSDMESKRNNKKLGGRMELNTEAENGELEKGSSDCMAVITNSTYPQTESVTNELLLSKITYTKGKTLSDAKKLPPLEHDFNRVREERTMTSTSERNVLKHSDLSAFSRYNTTSNANQTPTGNVGSCSPPDNSSEEEKNRSMHNLESHSNGTPKQRSNGSSNNDMGSTTNNAFSKPEALKDKQVLKSVVNPHSNSAFQSVKNFHNPSIPPEIQDKADSESTQGRTLDQQFQVQHHHHHYHHHHHHVHNIQQNKQISDHDNLSLRNKDASASNFGPSNVLATPCEGNAANYSLSGSASGSNNKRDGEIGSNEKNVNNTIGVAKGTNMPSNGGSGKNEAEELNGSGIRSGLDQKRSAEREAALHKFRQKRKDRCFEKKVRYQSRKKLAEQRPRVKGQFVRQVVNDVKIEDSNS